ncbi:MAG: NADH-quinone oxidoreductase subunit N [Thermoanaerobaculales bacterium]|nr:NADH-quinone oxidoreductase subunit N [Thermoanaerobaculales bacterium]
MTMTLDQFIPFLPEIFLATAGFVVLLLGVSMGRRGVRPLSLLGIASLAVAGVLVWLVARPIDGPVSILGDMLVVDSLAVFFKLLVLAAGAMTLMMSAGYLERSGYGGGEYVSLILFATVGMFVMASGANLASLYVGLELMALSVYVLVGYFKLETKSNEGAVKYFVLGAASSAVLLYGISLVYGALGTLDLATIRSTLTAVPSTNPMLALGMILVSFGMLFKVAAVPFHVWTPDAYEGAPTPVTAFISVAPKAAAFAMFMRLFLGAFAPGVDQWRVILWVAAAATMIFGNVAALTQDNVKRMLAYSSIAHAGYALMGIVAANAMGAWALLLYMVVYAFMNLGAFGFVILLESKGYAGEVIGDYAGLSRRHPGAALGMLIFMLALAGIPPTAGFMGKLYLFAAAVEGGYVVLTLIAVLMSAVSLYYYFRIVVQMYLRDGEEEGAAPAELLRDRWTEIAIAVCVIVTMIVGVFPAPLVGWAKSAAGALGMM